MILDDATLASKYIIKTHYIVRVMDVHPDKQTVDVMQDSYEFTLDPGGDYIVNNVFGIDVPASVSRPFIILGVPVKQERWGQFEIQCCPKIGDTGYIEVFTDDIREWVQKGYAAVPNTAEKFDVSSCVFVPFIPSHNSAAEDYPEKNNKLVIKSKNVRIEIVDDEEEEKKEINITAEKVNITSDINITGNIEMTGDVKMTGDFSQEGAMSVTGTISATKEIKSDEDVKAGSVSLKTHTHNFTVVTSGSATTQTGSGTTEGPK